MQNKYSYVHICFGNKRGKASTQLFRVKLLHSRVLYTKYRDGQDCYILIIEIIDPV